MDFVWAKKKNKKISPGITFLWWYEAAYLIYRGGKSIQKHIFISILIGDVCHSWTLSHFHQKYVVGYFNLTSDMLKNEHVYQVKYENILISQDILIIPCQSFYGEANEWMINVIRI